MLKRILSNSFSIYIAKFQLNIFKLSIALILSSSFACSSDDDDFNQLYSPTDSSLSPIGGGDGDDETPAVWGDVYFEDEPNNTFDVANDINFVKPIVGNLEYNDSSIDDYYVFNIPTSYEGYKVTISAVDYTGTCFYDVDPNIEIFDADKVTSLAWKEDSIDTYCPKISFLPPKLGSDYYIKLSSVVQELDGEYKISLAEGGSGTISGTVTSSKNAAVIANNGATITNTSSKSSIHDKKYQEKQRFVYGEVIVSLSPFMVWSSFEKNLRGDMNFDSKKPLPHKKLLGGRYHLLKLPMNANLSDEDKRRKTIEYINDIQKISGVKGVYPNTVMEVDAVPNDYYFSSYQWDLFSSSFGGMNFATAWDFYKGSSEVVVAVVDQGNLSQHPDLQNKFVQGYDFISDPENAGDNDGVDSNPEDNLRFSHGSHVAGTISAATNNLTGIAGAAWNTTYMPLRVCGNYGCTTSDIIESIYHASGYETTAGQGLNYRRADVINMSLGGFDSCEAPLQDAILIASNRGVVVVASAGNENDSSSRHTPANCLDVITVGATNKNLKKTEYSNYGSIIDVMAPGGDDSSGIMSTVYSKNSYEYETWQGTSMAAPHISALVAILKSINSTWSYDTILDILEESSVDVYCEGANATDCGYGMPDAYTAVSIANDYKSDSTKEVIIVEAVSVDDPDNRYWTIVENSKFLLTIEKPGNYYLRAGVDLNGNFLIGDEDFDEEVVSHSNALNISSRGDDLSGLDLKLP